MESETASSSGVIQPVLTVHDFGGGTSSFLPSEEMARALRNDAAVKLDDALEKLAGAGKGKIRLLSFGGLTELLGCLGEATEAARAMRATVPASDEDDEPDA